MTATAICKITVSPNENICNNYSYDYWVYSGSADASKENSTYPFDKHLSAVAETRAEGRAFRKLLRLQSIITAEEVDVKTINLELINDQQIQFIDRVCGAKETDINVESFIKSFHPKYKSIRTLTHAQAVDIIEILRKYEQNINSIPKKIKKYDSSWKDNFK
jgi:hypothetical protein